jgi:Helix-turn-helix domain
MPTAQILDEPLRTTKQVAARWQTSEETVRRKFRSESIKGVKIGGRLRFSLKEILKAEAKREV